MKTKKDLTELLETFKDKPLAELAYDAIVVWSDPKMHIDWNLLRKKLSEFVTSQNYDVVVNMVKVLTDAPYFLKREYKEPCLSCMLQNLADGVLGKGEEVGYCSNCTNDDETVIECKLLSSHHVISQCCAECCDDIKLLKS